MRRGHADHAAGRPHAGRSQTGAGAATGLHLLVMGPKQFATFALPARGEVIVGRGGGPASTSKSMTPKRRAATCASTSGARRRGGGRGPRQRQRHARARSPAGTGRAPARAAGRGDRDRLARADGAAQSTGAGGGARPRALSHAEFEGRVEWECARAEATGGTFSVARVRAASDAAPGRRGGRRRPAARPIDVVGLLRSRRVRAAAAGARRATPRARWRRRSRRRLGGAARGGVGVASYPDDGRHAGALLARAGARARGDERRDAGATTGPASRLSRASRTSMRRVQALAERAAAGDINVLILGETGVGKEVLARADPRARRRARRGRWSAINCAALSRVAARERAVRPRAGRVHRRGAGQARPARDRAGRHRVPRRGRRAAAAAAGQAPARDRDARGAARRRRAAARRSTCASSPRPTATSRRRCRAAASGATSTSGSTG